MPIHFVLTKIGAILRGVWPRPPGGETEAIFSIMASKNRVQLEEEAVELGLDPDEYATKADLAEAIKAAKPAGGDEDQGDEAPKGGCENCSNTGLEPGVARDTAQVCPVCKGSPFEPREEVK